MVSGRRLHACGAYERALTLSRLGPETVPELVAWRAVALASSGRAGEARATGEEFFRRLGRSWGGEEPFARDRALRWLDEVVLIPDESRRRQFVDAVSRITSSRGGSVAYRHPQRTMNPILLR